MQWGEESAGTSRILYAILGTARQVHAALGPGFLESIYNRALLFELKKANFRVECEKLIRIWYGSHLVGKHRLDLVIDGAVILELKATRSIVPVHCAQVKSYLQATDYAFGVILNFGLTELQWEVIKREVAEKED